MRKLLCLTVIYLAAGLLPSPLVSEVQACPGCKTANETDDPRPRAYMYSILFMLGMPATMFAGFGIAFYRLSRKAEPEQMMEYIPGEPAIQDPEV